MNQRIPARPRFALAPRKGIPTKPSWTAVKIVKLSAHIAAAQKL